MLVIEVRTSLDNTQPETRNQHSDWHNGYFIAAARKTAWGRPVPDTATPVFVYSAAMIRGTRKNAP